MQALLDRLYLQRNGMPDDQIPGFDLYSKNPLRGIEWLMQNIPKTVTIYAICILGELFCRDSQNILYSQDRGTTVYASAMMLYAVFLKVLFYIKLRNIRGATQDAQELRRSLRELFRAIIYTQNITATTLCDSLLTIRAIYCLAELAYSWFELPSSGPLWKKILVVLMPILTGIIVKMRGRLLTSSYSNRFQNLNQVDMNPFAMEEIVYSEQTATQIRETECVICADEWKEGDRLLDFGCPSKHHFHLLCLSKWLTQQTKCPMCRHIPAAEPA